MSMLLKVMHTPDLGPDPDLSEHSVYADVVSASFVLHGNRQCTIRTYVREPVKTALVPGFCENEKLIDLGPGCSAFLMNENGRTVSRYVAPMLAMQNGQQGRGESGGLGSVAAMDHRAMAVNPRFVTAPAQQSAL